MMKKIGSYEAKTHLPQILDEVERGLTVTITKHGRPVAKIVPIGPGQVEVADIIAQIKKDRRGRRMDVPLRKLIDDGRR
jgi:prevent-host-death family protein